MTISRVREPMDRTGVRSEGQDEAEARSADLASRIRRGDAAAFEEMARELAPRLYRLAVHLTGRPEEAEDLVQETLVRVLPALRRFEGRAKLSTYLVRALGNLWKNRLRSRSRSRVVDWFRIGTVEDREDARAIDPPDPGRTAEELLESEDRAVSVRRAVVRLRPERRHVLLLREVEGLSYEEISAITGVPTGTVRSRLARAREDLRRLLVGEGK